VLIVRLPDSEQWRVGDHLVGWFSDTKVRTWDRCMVVATLRKAFTVPTEVLGRHANTGPSNGSDGTRRVA
jgi:hypothetical protein